MSSWEACFLFIHHKLRKHHLIKQKHFNFSISKVQKYFWGCYYGAVIGQYVNSINIKQTLFNVIFTFRNKNIPGQIMLISFNNIHLPATEIVPINWHLFVIINYQVLVIIIAHVIVLSEIFDTFDRHHRFCITWLIM